MENSGEEAPMYSDSYLLPIIKELHKAYDGSEAEDPVPSLLTLVEGFIERATGNIEQGSKDALLEDRKGTLALLFLEHDLLIIGSLSSQDHLDVLRGKRVLLLISKIDMFFEDITSLKHVSIDTRQDEIVWIPVINRSIAELDPVKNQLETLQNSMPWYSVQPSMVTDVVIDFFKIDLSFVKPKTVLYLLSPSGKVLKYNAMDLVRIWPNISVNNLTVDDMVKHLWKKETWNLKLLVNDIIINPIMQKWIQDEMYIIMYGCNDIEWIRRFTRQVHSIGSDLHACIEMVYVGTRHNEDLGCGVQKVILIEQLSHCLPESSMAYFWTRIDCMIKSLKWLYPINPLKKQLFRFRSHEEWALLARGSTILVNGSGQIALNALEDMEKWRTKLLQS